MTPRRAVAQPPTKHLVLCPSLYVLVGLIQNMLDFSIYLPRDNALTIAKDLRTAVEMAENLWSPSWNRKTRNWWTRTDN